MDKLLRKFHCDTQLHELSLEHAKEKGFKLNDLNLFAQPETWDVLTEMIEDGRYHTPPSEIHYLNKETGDRISYQQAMEMKANGKKVRELNVLPGMHRVIWNSFYKICYDEFEYLIDPACVSYRKGESTRTVARKLNAQLTELGKYAGVKGDFQQFFDLVPIKVIDGTLNYLSELKPSKIWTPIKECYHDNRLIVNGELVERYTSLKQGNPMGCLLADLILRNVDAEMRKFDVVYYRYSDDFVLIGREWRKAFRKMRTMLNEMGIYLNDTKTEYLSHQRWFTFLGFRFKRSDVTISEKTLRNVRLRIKSLTIDKCSKLHRALTKREVQKAIDDIQYYFFVGCRKCNSGMGSYLYGADVLAHDIDKIEQYAKDCIRAALTNRCEIYGLGCSYGKYGIVDYNRGKNVGLNRLKISNEDIANLGWYSLNHMRQKYLQGKDVYQAEIQQMLNGTICEIE